MRFFTRERYDAMQVEDAAKREEAGRAWDRAVAAYSKHLSAIHAKLDQGARDLADDTMHDATVSSISTGGSQGDDGLAENVVFQFSSISGVYIKTGRGPGEGDVEFAWNIATNKK